jgi:hypothetical protein
LRKKKKGILRTVHQVTNTTTTVDGGLAPSLAAQPYFYSQNSISITPLQLK